MTREVLQIRRFKETLTTLSKWRNLRIAFRLPYSDFAVIPECACMYRLCSHSWQIEDEIAEGDREGLYDSAKVLWWNEEE
jgi:hypothetical protein